ncbi:MAG: sel1 repeat family protein [Candidatus Thioglobus sp.]|nr:MAG: sel1 repeat family protein [Candidatus Thioglobus sp.]KAA0446491.1 MAG: sel1 repeat family protein [Candidatus Thioglobus sp.]
MFWCSNWHRAIIIGKMRIMKLLFLLILSLNASALQLLQPKDAHNTVTQKLGSEQVLPAKGLLTQLKKAAKSGDARAQFSLANMYNHGISARRDVKLALYWYSQVAELGYPTAQFNLAELYYNGIGTTKNQTKALFWYEKSAQQDFTKSQYKLAKISAAEKDMKTAQYWYKRAAKLGHLQAQLDLAGLYEKGFGVKKDLKLARHWYEKSALQGNAAAQYYLGALFERTAKPVQALLLYKKSAKQGFAKAKSRLSQNASNPIVKSSKQSAAAKALEFDKISKSLAENSKILKARIKEFSLDAKNELTPQKFLPLPSDEK